MVDEIFKELLHLGENRYLRVFEIADYMSQLKLLKFKMADEKLKKLLDLDKTRYYGVFSVADYAYE